MKKVYINTKGLRRRSSDSRVLTTSQKWIKQSDSLLPNITFAENQSTPNISRITRYNH
jgi:hypothetical protein